MMKVKNTEIKVAMRKDGFAKLSSLRHMKSISETSLRRWISGILKQNSLSSKDFVSIAVEKEYLKDFSPVWAAKIITQEVLKVIRHQNKSYKTVAIYVNDQKIYELFKMHVFGYIKHIVENLGKGPYVTVDLIIEFPKGIVLIERSNPPLGWTLPGGFVDYGESLEDAAVREGKEETNLKLTNLKQFHTYSTPTRDPRFHTVSTVFIAKGKGKPKAGDDAKGLIIVPYKDLLKREYPFDHKQVVKDYLEFRK